MITSRTPFRISFAGGGSDLEAFYVHESGAVVSTAIDKYMYIALHPYFYQHQTLVKYSKTELVDNVSEIQHPIVREVLMMLNISGVDLNSISDIPAGTGLGSSSAFTVGLLKALFAYKKQYISRLQLAEKACDIEINRLGEVIGKQDQFASAFGGLNFIQFGSDGVTTVEKIVLGAEKQQQLENNLLLVYMNSTRSASNILLEQRDNIISHRGKRNMLSKMVKLAHSLNKSLSNGEIEAVGDVLHQSWCYKRELASKISTSEIDDIYEVALKNGALGGKMLGAGGGGFFLFYVKQERRQSLLNALSGLNELKFKFESIGSIIVGDD